MITEIPLGGYDLDYNSKQSRAEAINCYVEGEKEYYSVVGADGLLLFKDTTELYIRSNLIFVDNLIFFVAGNDLYQVDKLGNLTDHGVVGGAGRCWLSANNIPDDSQVLVLNGNGQAYVYQPSVGLTLVTDVDFYPASYASVLNERFWLPKDNSNQFFASAVSDGTNYPSGAIATADTFPDNVVATVAHKGALWVLGEKNSEYWQYVNDATLPVRQTRGAVYERGCAAVQSVATTGDAFCFFADDFTVRMVRGTQMEEVSNLAFRMEVKGDGTLDNPGYDKFDDAYAYYVDGPIHKIYYLTFPTEGVTWGYDLSTGLWHKRETFGLGYWIPSGAVLAWGKIIVGDATSGKLYYLTPDSRTENGTKIEKEVTCPSVSWRNDVTIPYIEIDMETGVGLESGADPLMDVSYSKDGGNTWINHSPVSIGKVGDYKRRVRISQIGRVVRNRDFILRLKMTAPVEWRMYRAYAYVEEGM